MTHQPQSAEHPGWHRRRPLVGGALIAIAGIEIFFSGQLDLGSIRVSLGIEGFQATVIPAALLLLGALIVVMPQHRIFYGVIALVISIYALVGVNLGGFVVGTLLGCVGGVLAVAWMPSGRRRPQRTPGTESSGAGEPESPGTDEPGSDAPDADAPSVDADAPERAGGAESRRARTSTTGRRALLALGCAAAVAAGSVVTPVGAASAAERPTRFCIPIPFLVSCDSPVPMPSSTPTQTPLPTPSGSSDVGSGATPGAGSSETGDSNGDPVSPAPAPPSRQADAAWGAPVVDDTMIVTSPGVPTTGTSLSLTGIPTIGLVDVKTVDGTRRTVLKLTAESVTMEGFALDVQPATGDGHGLLTVDQRIELTGGVSIYLDNISIVAGGQTLSLGVDTPAPSSGSPTSAVQLRMGLVGVVAGDVHHVDTHQSIH